MNCQGVAQVIRPLDRMTFFILPMKTVLDRGVGIEDLMNHLETDLGLKYFKDEASAITLGPDVAMYIPHGNVVMPFYGSGGKPWAHFWQFPVFDKIAGKKLVAKTRTAIWELKNSYMKTCAESFWAHRLTILGEWINELKKKKK